MSSYTYVDTDTNRKINITHQPIDGNNELQWPDQGGEIATLDDLANGVIAKAAYIKKPAIITPLNNTVNFTGEITITPYETFKNYIGVCTKTRVQTSSTLDFNIVTSEKYIDGESTDILVTGLISNTDVYIRVQYISNILNSDWSDPIKVSVGQLESIGKPSILNPIDNSKDQLLNTFITTSAFNVIGATDSSHVSTEYQIASDIDFTTIVHQEVSTTNLTSIFITTILENNKDYYIRVRHTGSKYGTSPWSNIVKITTYSILIDFGEDDLTLIQAGNVLDGAYFGDITIDKLIGDRDYRGSYIAGTNYIAKQQVSFNNAVYTAKVNNVNVTPGSDATKWELDTKENLPTGKWLLDVVGIGYGLSDNNADGYSSGSLSIGALKNNDTGYLKFGYNNKIIYVAKKPFVSTIAWNDLAKRYAVYGDRTVRIGSRLYYVRLLKEEEYLACLTGVTNGTLGNLNPTLLELSEKTWVHDIREGTVRKTLSNTNTVTDIDPKSRTGAYRPVLELIEEGNEPYNNLPASPLATSENFQYDKYTDTGYFGIVPAASIMSGSTLASSIGLSAGTPQNDAEGYLKFYWHGKIVFVAKKSYRHTVSWDNIKSAGAIFGVDLGGTAKKQVTKNTFKFNVGLLTGSNKAPQSDVQYWANYFDDASPTSTDDFAANVAMEIGRYSMWNELIYRVHTKFVDNILANQDGDASYKEITGGPQIGNNWANMTNTDLNVYYADGGNGTATWCQEISSYVSTYRVYRGLYRVALSAWDASSNSNAGHGWRPLLVLNP